MQERIPTAGVLLYEGSSILLVRHTEYAKLPIGSYGFPAGRIEDGELPVETAPRELCEETGLITFPHFLYRVVKKPNTIKLKKGWLYGTIELFFCDDYFGELRPSRETIPEFIETEEVDGLPLLVSNDVIEITREYQGYTPPGRR